MRCNSWCFESKFYKGKQRWYSENIHIVEHQIFMGNLRCIFFVPSHGNESILTFSSLFRLESRQRCNFQREMYTLAMYERPTWRLTCFEDFQNWAMKYTTFCVELFSSSSSPWWCCTAIWRGNMLSGWTAQKDSTSTILHGTKIEMNSRIERSSFSNFESKEWKNICCCSCCCSCSCSNFGMTLTSTAAMKAGCGIACDHAKNKFTHK